MNITATIISLNEEQYIGRCLTSLKDMVSNVIVIDGGSSDKTVEICQQFGATVLHREFDFDFSAQRNFAIENVKTEWTLVLDCDEWLPKHTGNYIQRVIKNTGPETVAYAFWRTNYVGTNPSPIKTNAYTIRLFRSAICRYKNKLHETVIVKGKVINAPQNFGIYHQKSICRQQFNNQLYANIKGNEKIMPPDKDGTSREIMQVDASGLPIFPAPIQVSMKPPQNKVLIIGSGPSAAMAKNLNLKEFDVICVNNSWAAVPDPNDIDCWNYSTDFYPRIEQHTKEGRVQMVPNDELKRILDTKTIKWKATNFAHDKEGCFFGTMGFIFFDVVSPVFKSIKKHDRWEEVWFLGCDHDYTAIKAAKGNSHFYGDSERLPQKDEELLKYFQKIKLAGDELGIKLVVASENKEGLLWRGIHEPIDKSKLIWPLPAIKNECNELNALKSRNFKDYSIGHQKMYTVPIDLLTVEKAPPLDIIDVGFGIGFGIEKILNAGIVKRYYGVEPCLDSYNYVKTRYGNDNRLVLEHVGWLQANPPFEADYVFCIEVIEHVDEKDIPEFLKKLEAYTVKNLFLSTPNKQTSAHGIKTTSDWRLLLKAAGFEDVVYIERQWTTLFIA